MFEDLGFMETPQPMGGWMGGLTGWLKGGSMGGVRLNH